jgi:hypothetical protein
VLGCSRSLPHIPFITPMVSPFVASLSSRPSVLFEEPFETLDAAQWHEVEVKGQTDYGLATLEGNACLQAHSHSGASILLHLVRFDPDVYKWLSWRWRVDQFVQGEALRTKGGSDASARVYVYFDTPGLPWQKRSLDYVWSSTLPEGTVLESAYSKTAKIIVVQHGAAAQGQWQLVTRNIEDDYRRCFGGSVPDVVSIGVMVDADNSHGEGLAYFDDIRISRE